MANLLGIEIGSESVRGALVKTAIRKVQIARFIEVPIEPAIVVDAPLTDADGIALPPAEIEDPVKVAVRELLRQVGSPPPSIMASLEGEHASIRRIELPAATAKKLDELLPFEMEALVPFDAEQTMLDHQTIEIADGKLRLLVVAAAKDQIRARIDELERWGADPQELAVGAAALDGLPALIPALATEGPHLVVHLGSRRTDICVLRRGRCDLARTISAGATEIHGASFATAGAGPAADRFIRDLKQTLSAWRMQGGAAIASVHVGGVGLHEPRFVSWIGEVLGQPAEMRAIPDSIPGSAMDGETRARYAMALALAGRALGRGKRIDLRKGEFVARRTSGWIRQHAPLLASCAAAIVIAFFFSTYARWSVLDARRQVLQDELTRVSRERLGEETDSPDRARTLLAGGGSRTDPLPRFSAYDAIAAISAAIPEDIPHDVQRLHVDLGDDRSGGHFELAGVVATIEERDRIAQALSQVECFQEIELGPLTQAPNERRSYRVEADILCPGDVSPEETRRGRGGRSRSTGGASSGSAGGGR